MVLTRSMNNRLSSTRQLHRSLSPRKFDRPRGNNKNFRIHNNRPTEAKLSIVGGTRSSDFKAHVQGRLLTIIRQRNNTRRQFFFFLGHLIDTKRLVANFTNGVLTVTAPKDAPTASNSTGDSPAIERTHYIYDESEL